MKVFYVLVVLAFASIVQAQDVIYLDEFDNDVLATGFVADGYTPSIADDNFRITGDGSASAWAAVLYTMHDGTGEAISVDASAYTKVFIRAKCEGIADLRMDLQDGSGYSTNLQPVSMELTGDYAIYQYDYAGKLEDGAFGGPCMTAPCPVDPSDLRELVFFVNAADGGYAGSIDIDWISIGAIPDQVSFVDHDIRYNQVSYMPDRRKVFSVVAQEVFTDLPYEVYEAGATTPILEGTASTSSVWSPSQEFVATVDLSAVNEPGDYRFVTNQRSVDFTVSDDGYTELCEASLKYYYYNRASQELTETHAGPWARPLGHPDDEVRVHFSAASETRPTGTIISSPKGWYDAGDYNKYIVNSGISTYTLLAAYEHYQDYYDDLVIDIPEQGGDLPDILDEIAWNLDWMLTMQDPEDGGVYHKLTGLNFSGIIMPHRYSATRYVVQKSTSAALNLAAVAATASRIFAQYEDVRPGYSGQLLQAARDAYAWAKANPRDYYNQPSNVRTGEYGDSNVTDEFDWAAAELFITTKETTYSDDIFVASIGTGIPSWQYTAPLALISLAHHSAEVADNIDPQVIRQKLLSTANPLRSFVTQSPMRVAMGSGSNDFVWGSNGQAGNQIIFLIRAYELSGEPSYLDAAYVAMDYLLGRNGTGYCYVSGFGDLSPVRPHHRQSEADNVTAPVPGMVAGGPNPGRQDGCSGYVGLEPARSYVDSWCSYASNEVTINWNAPLAYAVNALHYYQNKSTTSVDRVDSKSDTGSLDVYPNPGSSTIQVPRLRSDADQHLQIINLNGQVMHDQHRINEANVDVSGLPQGMYVISLIEDDRIYRTRWMKID
jgi:endoglucanase